jgi:hypothetical protein
MAIGPTNQGGGQPLTLAQRDMLLQQGVNPNDAAAGNVLTPMFDLQQQQGQQQQDALRALSQAFAQRQPALQQAGQALTQQGTMQAQEQARQQELYNRFNRAATGQLGGSQDATQRARIQGGLANNVAQARLQGDNLTRQLQQQADTQQAQAAGGLSQQNPFLGAMHQTQLQGMGAQMQGLEALQRIQQAQQQAQTQNDVLFGNTLGNVLTQSGNIAQMVNNNRANQPQQQQQQQQPYSTGTSIDMTAPLTTPGGVNAYGYSTIFNR